MIKLEAIIKTVPGEEIMSLGASVLQLDLKDAETNFDKFESEFTLVLTKTAKINAIVGWFDVEMTANSWLSTSPYEPATHWEQTVFQIIGLQDLEKGAEITGRISCKPQEVNHRGLDLTLSLRCTRESSSLLFNYFIQ